MPKPVRNPFKILAPLRLGVLAFKFHGMGTAYPSRYAPAARIAPATAAGTR